MVIIIIIMKQMSLLSLFLMLDFSSMNKFNRGAVEKG